MLVRRNRPSGYLLSRPKGLEEYHPRPEMVSIVKRIVILGNTEYSLKSWSFERNFWSETARSANFSAKFFAFFSLSPPASTVIL